MTNDSDVTPSEHGSSAALRAQGRFFEFGQNNSGGSFDIDDERGIGARVYVEAFNAAHANERAEQIGLYFEGVNDGRDCECCGDRWGSAWGEGDEIMKLDPMYSFNWHDTVYVHRLNGDIERWTLAKWENQPRGLSAAETPNSVEGVNKDPL